MFTVCCNTNTPFNLNINDFDNSLSILLSSQNYQIAQAELINIFKKNINKLNKILILLFEYLKMDTHNPTTMSKVISYILGSINTSKVVLDEIVKDASKDPLFAMILPMLESPMIQLANIDQVIQMVIPNDDQNTPVLKIGIYMLLNKTNINSLNNIIEPTYTEFMKGYNSTNYASILMNFFVFIYTKIEINKLNQVELLLNILSNDFSN